MVRRIIYCALFALLLSLIPTPYSPNPTFAQNCSSSYSDRVQNGLISSPQIQSGSKIGGTSGACIIDPKAAFAPYKVPTYDDLKSFYYSQAKSSVRKDQITCSPTPCSPTQGDFTSKFTQNDIVLVNGDLTGINYTGTTKPSVVFVEGNLSIDNNITYGDANSGLVFVVKGNVNIFQNVTRIDAVIISQGIICTAFNGTSCPASSVSTLQLIINGSLISLNESVPIRFRRELADNSQAAERINHQVKYLVILRNLLSDTFQRWSEITGDGTPPPAPVPGPTAFPATGLVAYWKMDETSGSTVNDLQSTNNGTAFGATIITSGQKLGAAARSFDGNDYITIPDSPSIKPANTTISVWVKTSDSAGVIIEKYNQNSPYEGYSIITGVVAACATRVSFWVGGSTWTCGTTAINNNIWRHIVTTYDGTNAKIYIDGALQTTQAQTANFNFTGALNVGRRSTGSDFLIGTIDELGIWNRALSAGEVTTLWNSGAGRQP